MIHLEMKTTGSRLSTAQTNQRKLFSKEQLKKPGKECGNSEGLTCCHRVWTVLVWNHRSVSAHFYPWVVLKTGMFSAFSSLMAQDKGFSWVWTLLEPGQDSWAYWVLVAVVVVVIVVTAVASVGLHPWQVQCGPWNSAGLGNVCHRP